MIGARGIDAHGQIVVKTDRHPPLTSDFSRLRKLLLAQPLKIDEEGNPLDMVALKVRHRGGIPFSVFGRPA